MFIVFWNPADLAQLGALDTSWRVTPLGPLGTSKLDEERAGPCLACYVNIPDISMVQKENIPRKPWFDLSNMTNIGESPCISNVPAFSRSFSPTLSRAPWPKKARLLPGVERCDQHSGKLQFLDQLVDLNFAKRESMVFLMTFLGSWWSSHRFFWRVNGTGVFLRTLMTS